MCHLACFSEKDRWPPTVPVAAPGRGPTLKNPDANWEQTDLSYCNTECRLGFVAQSGDAIYTAAGALPTFNAASVIKYKDAGRYRGKFGRWLHCGAFEVRRADLPEESKRHTSR